MVQILCAGSSAVAVWTTFRWKARRRAATATLICPSGTTALTRRGWTMWSSRVCGTLPSPSSFITGLTRNNEGQCESSGVRGTLPSPSSFITGLTRNNEGQCESSGVCGTLPFPLSSTTSLTRNNEGRCESSGVCGTLPFPLSSITGIMRNNEEQYENSWGVWNFTISFVFHYRCQKTVMNCMSTEEHLELGSIHFVSCQWSSAEHRRTAWHLELCHFLWLPLLVSWRTMWNCVSAEKWVALGSCLSDFHRFSTCAKLSHEEWQGAVWMLKVVSNCGSFHFISFVTHHFSKPTELYLSSYELFDWLGSWMANMDIYINCFLLSSIAGHSKRSTQQCGYWRM